jgi:5,10-methylenetetrahydrofolate reductase
MCPGITIPDAGDRALGRSAEPKLEGRKICVEMMQAVREMAGVSGVHVMAYRQEELVAEIVHESGVLAGRQPWRREPEPDEARIADRLQSMRAGSA